MLKRLLVIFILSPLLFNGVWASAHFTEDDHHSHYVPHLHLDAENHTIIKYEQNNDEPSEQEAHEHFHIYLNAFIKTDELKHFGKCNTSNLFGFNSRFTSLVPSPPVPPPNI